MIRPAIQLSVLLWFVALTLLLGYVVSAGLRFGKIFGTHSGIRLTQTEAALAFNATGNDQRRQYIPKIIHQVYHNWKEPGNEELPSDWDELRKTCIDANPASDGWDYKLWTEKASRDFLEEHYAWFLGTYDSYRFPVQRVDAVRYYLLLHFGGIYLDLDNGCMGDLTPLLYYPMWITDGGQGALSNNILASMPHHPFWALLCQSLYDWNHNYLFPYITISYASGQWFETAIWELYHSYLPAADQLRLGHENRLHALLMDDRPDLDQWLFFTQARGGTWKNWDNHFFLWIGNHLLLFLLMLVGSIVTGLFGGVKLFRRFKYSRYIRMRQTELPGRYEP